jgi:hypothetical protein
MYSYFTGPEATYRSMNIDRDREGYILEEKNTNFNN